MTSLKSVAIRGTLKLFGSLPLGAARALGKGLSVLIRLAARDLRRTIGINLQLTHPAMDAQALSQLTDDCIEHTVINALEMTALWHHDNDWVAALPLQVEGIDVLRDALEQSSGVIIVCPHIGNWEFLGRYLPQLGTLTCLYQPPRLAELEELVKRGREQSGTRVVPTNQRGIAGLLKALRKGEMVGILPDQVPAKGSGVFAPWFGQPALTMTLIHSLMQKTGCRAVLGYALREDQGFRAIFKAAPEALYSNDQLVAVTALNAMVETAIASDCAQYQWGYKRFRKQPQGQRSPYKRTDG